MMGKELLQNKALADEVIEMRRHIHEYPGVSEHEEETMEYIAGKMKEWGIPYEAGVADTGLVAFIQGAGEGPVIGLRADIDALPIQEETGLPFASQNENIMHACGHDVHTAVLLGTAAVLAKHKELLRGNVKLFFQPAEESYGGAERMIAAGCMENPHVDAVFGLHVAPSLPAGKIGTKPGYINASADSIHVKIYGKSAHGASPEKGIDAIYIASQVVVALHGLASRRVRGTDAISLNVGKFHGGSANNIVCDCVELGIMFRTIRQETRDRLKEEISTLIHSLCNGFGGTAEITITPSYGSQRNDPTQYQKLVDLSQKLMGKNSFVEREEPSLVTEDFSYFGEHVPSVFFELGTGSAEGHPCVPLHSCQFTVDEDALYYGVLMETALVVDYLM